MFSKTGLLLLKYFLFIIIEFIGVSLVNEIIQVPDAKFHNTSSVRFTVWSPPQVPVKWKTLFDSSMMS